MNWFYCLSLQGQASRLRIGFNDSEKDSNFGIEYNTWGLINLIGSIALICKVKQAVLELSVMTVRKIRNFDRQIQILRLIIK